MKKYVYIAQVFLILCIAQSVFAGELYMKPWTTPTLQGNTAHCWGRVYDYSSSLLPAEIVSQKQNILAGPIQLVATIAGKKVKWTNLSFTAVGSDKEAVRYVTSVTSPGLSVKCAYTTEFDGMTRVDIKLTAKKEITLDSLELVVPLKQTYVSYFHHASVYPTHVWDWPKKRMNAGAVKADGMKLPFVNHLWLGNDDRGIQFFSESDESWSTADPESAITVTPDGKVTNLTMNLLSNSKIVREWSWDFGFMATPVKPWPADYYKMRYCHMGAYGIEKNQYSGQTADQATPPYLDVLGNLGVNYLGIHEWWSDQQSLPRPKNPDALWSLLAACKAKGMGLVPYTGCYMSTRSPEYSKNWDSLPIGDFYQYQRPDNQDICRIVCNATGYPDLVVSSFTSAYKEYGFGGIYTDGLTCPLPCVNTKHGCGYKGKDGKIHPTMAIWRTREAMKSLYRLVKGQSKPGILFCHTSASVLLPALSFADFYVDGEHLLSMMKLGTPEYSEDIIRAEMSGHNFGIPATQLPISGNTVERERARTLAILYDMMTIWHPEHQADIWKAFGSFGMDGAVWVPYWKTQELLQSSDTDNFKISAYLRKGRGALFIVANLGTSKASTRLTANRAGMGLTAKSGIRCRDEVNGGQELTMTGSSLEITVEPGTFRMVSIQRSKK